MKEYLKILIADDEEEARSLICFYLNENEEKYIATEATNGNEVMDLINGQSFDLLFLDVKMPGLSGIDVLSKIEKDALPAIIFTTAFDKYALAAFDYDAVDYLLKPFDQNRFQKALQKAIHYIEFIKLNKDNGYLSKIILKSGSKTDIIPINEILFFRGDGIYVQVVTKDKTYLYNEKPLYELQALLPPSYFIRIHKSYIVNFHFIRGVKSLLNGDCTVLLKNNREIRASRTYKDKLKYVLRDI